jgi:hypothetical protein
LIKDHDAIFLTLVGSLNRANRHAGRFVTLVAKPRHELAFDLWVIAFFNEFNPGPNGTQWDIEFAFTRDRASMTALTLPGINHHSVLYGADRGV